MSSQLDDLPLKDCSVLVVDDEILIALDLEATLRSSGADIVGPCTNAAAALDAIKITPPDAAVLDIRLGRETSEAIADRLAAEGIPFVFYSGQTLPTTMRAKFAGAQILTKPVQGRELIDAVARLVERMD